MRKLLVVNFFAIFVFVGCGMSEKDKTEISQITCNVIEATRNMDAAQRIKEINAAREQMGEERFLGTDGDIIESVGFGLCVNLVRNDEDYETKLTSSKKARQMRLEQERIAREKVEEKERIAREKLAQEERKKAEQERIAKQKKAKEDKLPYFCQTPVFNFWAFADRSISAGYIPIDVIITEIKQGELDLSPIEESSLSSTISQTLSEFTLNQKLKENTMFSAVDIRVNIGESPTLYTTINKSDNKVVVVNSWGKREVATGICKKSEYRK